MTTLITAAKETNVWWALDGTSELEVIQRSRGGKVSKETVVLCQWGE